MVRDGDMIIPQLSDADVYVRDQLLIQFMLNRYVDDVLEVEEVYKEWQKWLKEQEARHDKRSEV